MAEAVARRLLTADSLGRLGLAARQREDTGVWIARVRVNGGFLAGLDVSLEPGLNVVVGPRGAGKTTLLELIRHALGIQHPDEGEARRQQRAIEQLLGAGEVIVEIQDDDASHHLVVDASGSGRSTETATIALALGQNELERIASSSASRLNLIDLRAVVDAEPPSLAPAKSLTLQIAATRFEIERRAESAGRRRVLEASRAEAVSEERALLEGNAADLSARREVLRGLESELLQLSAQSHAAATGAASVADARRLAEELVDAVENLTPSDASVAVAASMEPRVATLRGYLTSVTTELADLSEELTVIESQLSAEQDSLRVQAEPVRAELEAAETGLGQVTARLRNIDAELAQLARSDVTLQERRSHLNELKRDRESLLDEFEEWQESLFQARQRIANTVSADLQNRVVVSVDHLADSSRFRDLLVDLLQGSGLQYRPLSETLAKSLLPRQLLLHVEEGNAEALATAAEIGVDRAGRIIAHLAEPDRASALATCTLDDKVDFRLRDGAADKSVENLSTGQKCAVTLPIVLTELSRVLILDQPEDHLDNAYLVDHVVNALESRGSYGAQTIVATHNANIPVLGSAPMVISLGSDGTRGFVAERGPFDEDAIVAVITTLMEGGRDAFRRRAEFYAAHGGARD